MIYIREDFYVCPNAISADSLPFCVYDCAYCFIKTMPDFMKVKPDVDMYSRLEKTINKFKNLNLSVILGRKSEPFTPNFLDQTIRYIGRLKSEGLKVVVETKQNPPVDKINELVDGVLVSLIPGSEEFVCKLEPNLPTPKERLQFINQLSETGIWVGVISEPLVCGYNTDYATLSEHLKKVAENGAKFVNFGPLKCNNLKVLDEKFEKLGINLLKVIQSEKYGWVAIGKDFIDLAHQEGLKVASPDWVNFGLLNDTEGCCGLDEFGNHHLTFQHALKLLKNKGSVCIDDVLKKNILPRSYVDKFKFLWNGNDKRYYSLKDVKGVTIKGKDKNGFNIYGLKEGLR